MINAYRRLRALGVARSVEAWCGGVKINSPGAGFR